MDPSLIPSNPQDTTDEPLIPHVSTTRLLSLELSHLMPLLSNNVETLFVEDTSYINTAVQNVSLAKSCQKIDDYSGAMKAMSKALRTITELVQLRKDNGQPLYAVLEAPFYYQQGNIMVSYIETKSDVFGNVPQINMEESSSEESEDIEGEPGIIEKENALNTANSNSNIEEPRIEDEVIVAHSKKTDDDLEEEKVGAADGGEQKQE